MGSSQEFEFSIQEIIGTLKNTGLPTVLVEGSSDIIVYRRCEERLRDIGVDFVKVGKRKDTGGRKMVLAVFEHRCHIPNVQLAFIVDNDVWINSGVPSKYCSDRLIRTSGYSIENDVFVDGNLEGLLTPSELASFQKDLASFLDWYALALNRHLADNTKPIKTHPNKVLNPDHYPTLTKLEPTETYPTALRDEMASDYKMKLRGKSLFGLLLRQLGRGSGRYNDDSLLNIVAVSPGALIQSIESKVRAVFTPSLGTEN